jgi:hypothetical protein
MSSLIPFSSDVHARWRMVAFVAWLLFVFFTDANGQEDQWRVAARPELTIGEADGEEVYLFQSIAAARFLSGGRVVVADRGLLELRIYGPDGRFQRRVGRRGNGPGEFVHIGGVWLTSTGEIAVWDGRSRRITRFDDQGHLKNTHTVRENPLGGNLEVYLGSFSNDEIVLASLHLGTRAPDEVPDRWMLGRFALDGSYRGPVGSARGMRRFNGYPIPFSPIPAAIVYGDSLYLVDGYEPEIAVRDARGLVVHSIRVPPAEPVSGHNAWSALERELRRRQAEGSTAFTNLLLGYMERGLVPRSRRLPQVGGLVGDSRGFIWVKAYDALEDAVWLKAHPMSPGVGGEWRVVTSSGKVVSTVQLPPGVRPLEIDDSRLLGVAIDGLGVERLVLHRIYRQ